MNDCNHIEDGTAELYIFPQDIGPTKSGPGVSIAKSKHADEHDLPYDSLKGRKVGYTGNDLIVVVIEDPVRDGLVEDKG